jgi:stage II sporulation protein M
MMVLWYFYQKLLNQNAIWLKRAAAWALLSAGIGIFTYAVDPGLLPKFLEFLEGIFQNILGSSSFSLDFPTTLRIFENNLTVGSLIMFLGIFFGLLPLLSLSLNFFIVGFLAAAFIGTGTIGRVGIFFLSIFPHGIIELPAFLIAAAFGLKLGSFWFKPDRSQSVWGNLKQSLKENLQILPLLAVFFFLAAVVEVFVSGRLVEWLVK